MGKDPRDQIDATSLERIIPDELLADEATGFETLGLHLARYEFAKTNLVQGTLLDMACGVGYGTALLLERPGVSMALGVDISAVAVDYANGRYSSRHVSFTCSGAREFSPS